MINTFSVDDFSLQQDDAKQGEQLKEELKSEAGMITLGNC